MAKSISSNCSPDMLRWARNSAGYSLEEAAKKLKVDSLTLEEWEVGIDLPTYRQLEEIAHCYRRPTMVFYLVEPPPDFTVIKDFRTIASSGVHLTPKAIFAIRQSQQRQAWAVEHLEKEDAERVSFVAATKLNSSVTESAKKLRSIVGMTLQDQMQSESLHAAYRNWKSKIETCGVFVFEFSGIQVSEMRGFALAHEIAPAIAVNNKDGYPARTFTLLHEFAHLMLGESGISDLERSSSSDPIERFCERVSAETLMPAEEFLRMLPTDWKKRTVKAARELAYLFRCSVTAAIYRFVDLDLLTFDNAYPLVRSLHRKEEAEKIEKSPSRPIPQERLAAARNGLNFSRLAVSAFEGGAIHGGELAGLLEMRIHHLPKFEKIIKISGKN